MNTTKHIKFRAFFLAFVFLLSGQENAFSQNQLFGPQRPLTGGLVSNPRALFSDDLNNDNLQDVICTSYNTIVWYENKGENNFDLQKMLIGYSDWDNIRSAFGDLDGDGDVDIVFSSHYNASLAWVENTGSGTYDSLHIISLTVLQPSSLLTSDLDGDNDMDLLLYSQKADELLLFKNNGSGIFSEAELIMGFDNGNLGIKVFDIDGDEDVDIVANYRRNSDGFHEFFWIENNGIGEFNDQHFIAINEIKSFHVDDLDNDNDIDIIAKIEDGYKLVWLENDGNGIFENQYFLDSTDGSSTYNVISTADIDNDGDKDILSNTDGNTEIYWHENKGSGLFSIKQQLSSTSGCNLIFPCHLNNDSFVDIAVIKNGVVWLKNQMDNTFSDPILLSSKTPHATDVCATDLDGDGDKDIISASWEIAWYENIGYQTFGEQIIIQPFRSLGGLSVLTNDMDNDMDQDIVSSDWFGSPAIHWYSNKGEGEFDSTIAVDSWYETEEICSKDFDGDGDIDLLSAAYQGIYYHENLGKGIFNEKLAIELIYNYNNHVFASDLDNDMDVDILFSRPYGHRIAYYKNDGNGNFDDRTVISTANKPADVWANDLNNDGNNDVIAIISDRVVWFENFGVGVFGEEQLIADTVSSPQALFSADLDNDGFYDVLYSCRPSKIIWHQNLGNGNFGKPRIITNKARAVKIFTSDLDDDGDLDILTAGSGSIAWYENLLITTSEDEINETSHLANIYPNPATNSFTIQSPAFEQENATVEIFDLYGRLVQKIEIPAGKSGVNIQIDHLQKGVYIIRLSGSQNYSCKLVKN